MVDFGSLVNKAKDFARKNPDKLRDGLSKAEDTISSKTGGKYDSQIHSAGDKVEQQLGVDEQKAAKPAQDVSTQDGAAGRQNGDAT